jgi:predicted nucleotidyltransferase
MAEFFQITTEQKRKLKAVLTKELKQRKEITFAYLHGSFIDPVASFRDIDVAVWLSKKVLTFSYKFDLEIALEQQLHYPVDVQLLNNAPLGFKFSVFKYGELLFCRNEQLLTDLIEEVAVNYMSFYEAAGAEFK